MFDLVMTAHAGPGRRVWTTGLGAAGEVLLVAAAVVVPLMSPEALPRLSPGIVQMLAPAAPPPPPAPRGTQVPGPRIVRDFQIRQGVLTAPASVPPRPVFIDEPPVAPGVQGAGGGVEGGVPGGLPGGLPGALLSAVVRHVAPPPPPAAVSAPEPSAPKAPAAIPRVKAGGLVQQGKLISRVIPVYPPLALQARISGTVNLIGLIGTDGRVRSLQVESGHPLMVPAALEAVRKWIYRPTFLNGEPVEVLAPICVTFALHGTSKDYAHQSKLAP